MWASVLLHELGLANFEVPFCSRFGDYTLEELAQVKYEELLEIGLSKVQCHLFFQKVAEYVADRGNLPALSAAGAIEDGVIKVSEGQESDLERSMARYTSPEGDDADAASAHRMLKDVDPALVAEASSSWPPGLRQAALRQLMPPPLRSPAREGASLPARSSRKRARSSHLSNHAAFGSEALSTAGSASGSSSSSLHLEIRVKKRRLGPRTERSHSTGLRSIGPGHCHRSPRSIIGDTTDAERDRVLADEEVQCQEADSHSL